MQTQNGFTLVELMVVVAVIGIILAVATLNFHQLNEKYRVESATKEIHSLLMRARNDASRTNTSRSVALTAHDVTSGTITANFPQFTLTFAGSPIVFDRRGMSTGFNSNLTLRITDLSGNFIPAAAMDCIVISPTRINTGKWSGAACVQR